MYLKRIEIMGFKSFADRTELEFVPGVTAVVGPNGSGKSNIADAVRWVLGEQSAKTLRGTKMEDVIFAGSDSRKPVNFGEVSLTLDNTCSTLPLDFSEVTITRRIYRSGESEYYINRTQCRLKDITELFMDTGLGKEAYSIIGQGKIEEVLSNKSEERRGIFEEAAGIVKYKSRKKEAQKKLEETENNLIRISDIIAEINDQIEPLKEQASKALKYKELKEELKNQEIGLYVYNIEQVHEKWQESKQKIEEFSEAQLKLSAEVNSRDAIIEQKRWRINQLDQELERMQQQLLETVEQLEKQEGELKVLEERKKNATENRSAIAENMEKLLQKKESLTRKLEEMRNERQALAANVERLTEDLRMEETRWQGLNQFLDSNLEQLKSEYIELLGEMATARNEHKNIEQQKQAHLHKQERIMAERNRQKEAADQLLLEINNQQEHLHQVRQKMDHLHGKYREIQQEQQKLHLVYDQRTLELRQKEQVKEQIQSRLELLKEMQAEFSGFNQGVKEVLKARDRVIKGIHGAVAELIQVPKQYEIAIEIALGGALQHIVVEDEACGRAAISFLKKHNLGRATFLPLSVMRGRRPSSQDEKIFRNENGIIGIASDLISFSESYRGVMENLLGSVVVADNLETANHVARLTGQRYRIVTLEGDVVNPGGSMTGGALKQKSANLLGRGREIEDLEQRYLQKEQEWLQTKREIDSLQVRIRELDRELEELKSQGERIQREAQEASNLLIRLETEYKNLHERLQELELELTHFDTDSRQYDQQLVEILNRLQELQTVEANLKMAIELADKNKKDQENTKEEMTARITKLKISLAENRQLLESKEEGILALEQELRENESERSKLDEELRLLFSLMSDNDSLENEIRSRIDEAKQRKVETTDLIEAKKLERNTLVTEMDQMEKDTKDLRKNLRQVEDDLHKEEVKENRYEVELDNLLEKLRADYELTYEAAKVSYPAPNDEDIYLVRQEVFRLKRDIAALGEVNVGSIEEYERLKERHSFLTAQSEDLKAAKIALYQVIEEMDQEMKRRFLESFEQISYHFRQVFVQLFGGGRADLTLTDPDNLLETGIDIVAQPPGKKLQNLALLSGGERALTAIALLFAILRVRPVPFCVLDEVEAALDEANVYRFAKYLKEFSEETQFIVITHRKGTMENADVLYGVTMEGSGVSKLVSVRLDELERKTEGIAG